MLLHPKSITHPKNIKHPKSITHKQHLLAAFKEILQFPEKLKANVAASQSSLNQHIKLDTNRKKIKCLKQKQ